MFWSLLADFLVAVHLAYVAYVVIGQILILLGILWKWTWIRNPWFRVTHLAMIAIVAAESLLKMRCPLTVLEERLREGAGQPIEEASFVGRLLRGVLFLNLWDETTWVQDIVYVAFASVVVVCFVYVPPRFRGAKQSRDSQATIAPESRLNVDA